MSDSIIPAATEPAPEAAPVVTPEAVPEATPAVAAEAAPQAPSAAPIATPPDAQAATSKAAAIDLLLAQWAVECLHDSPVSRATEAMNHFTTIALPALRQCLLSEV